MKIAVVDYDEYTRKLLPEAVAVEKELKEYEIVCYENAEVFLGKLKETGDISEYFAVFIDFNTPKENGIKLSQELRTVGYDGVIVLMSYDPNAFYNYLDNYAESDSEMFPHDEFMKKPFTMEEPSKILMRYHTKI